MDFSYCANMNNNICFNGKDILFCTTGNNTKQNSNLMIKENFTGEGFDIEKYFELSEKIRNDCKQGSIIENCQGCHYIECKDWDNVAPFEKKIHYILVSNYRRCNSRCIYCIARCDYDPKTDKDLETYNIIPVIKEMINKKYVTEDTNFDFAGGECTLYPFFDELLDLLIDSGIKHIIIHSNAILYSKAIEKGIKKGIVSICVSTDSGTKKAHETVKGVKTYDTVWKHIKQYRKAKPDNTSNEVSVKYIIVEGKNDNEKEIEAWLKKAKEAKVNSIRFNADNDIFIKYQKSENTNHVYLAKVIVLSEFFAQKAKEYGIKWSLDYNVDAAYKMLNVRMPK